MAMSLAERVAAQVEREWPAVLERERKRRRCQRFIEDFCEALPPTTRGPYIAKGKRWVRKLLRRLQRFFEDSAAGRSPRLIITIPPQYGKSEAVKRAVLYAMGRWALPIAICTYSADLAQDHSKCIREWARGEEAQAAFPGLAEPAKRGDTGARNDFDRIDNWATLRGARLFSVGVGGPLTGRTVKAIVIDDPHKDHQDSRSPAGQAKVVGWYKSVVYTRASANKAGILVMHTRWDDNDLIGWLKSEEAKGGEQWETINLPALAEDGDWLGREPGQALDPDIHTEGELAVARRVMGDDFEALFQQRPVPAEGALWKRPWLAAGYDIPPKTQAVMCDWTLLSVDGAATDGAGDWTVIQWWGFKGPNAYLLGQWRGQWDAHVFEETLAEVIVSCRPSGTYIEDTSNGRAVRQRLQRRFAGVEGVKVKGNKAARIRPTLPLYAAGNVHFPAPEHMDDLAAMKGRLLRVTGQPGTREVDDEADAATIALTTWQEMGQGYGVDDLLAAADDLAGVGQW